MRVITDFLFCFLHLWLTWKQKRRLWDEWNTFYHSLGATYFTLGENKQNMVVIEVMNDLYSWLEGWPIRRH